MPAKLLTSINKERWAFSHTREPVYRQASQRRASLVATVLTPHIENVEVFLAHCHRRHYPATGTIVYVGDDADVLYYIIEGSVAVVL